jgi:hypothetical protein
MVPLAGIEPSRQLPVEGFYDHGNLFPNQSIILLIFIISLVKSQVFMLSPCHPESPVIASNQLRFTTFSLCFYPAVMVRGDRAARIMHFLAGPYAKTVFEQSKSKIGYQIRQPVRR